MVIRKLQVLNEEGLHSRPAMEFTQLAEHFTCSVTIEKDDMEVDAKSMLMVLSACICCGDEFILKTDGVDEQEAMESLAKYINELKEG